MSTKYQLGTARIFGRERVLLHACGRHIDLYALRREAASPAASSPRRRAPGTSGRLTLLRVLAQWDRWRQYLPGMVAYAFEHGEDNLPHAFVADSAIQWLPPLLYPSKLICIGTNYYDHIAEMSASLTGQPWPKPAFPYSFLKPATTTLVGSGAVLHLPGFASMIDWEAELALVIGRRVRDVTGDDALAAVACYSVFNDISARDFIRTPASVGIDWVMSKAFDGSSPMGPYLTPAEFVPDPQSLRITLEVNGKPKQDSTTANMVFGVREIVEHLSRIMTLEPGDVIATGTPAGVGFGQRPPELLKPGDTMVAEVEGLGRLTTVVAVGSTSILANEVKR